MNKDSVAVPKNKSTDYTEWLRYAQITLLGFSAGIPFFLIFSSLSLWLSQAGLEKSTITYFSWAALGYSFKFLWAPLVDRLPIWGVTALLGHRRGWLLLSQCAVIAAIVWMGLTNPQASEGHLTTMAFAAVLLGFSAATQDISIDAWRIEVANERTIAMMSSLYVVGYRVGMITSGAGALFLAAYFGTTAEDYNYEAWRSSYLIMAATMLVGVLTTLLIPEPQTAVKRAIHSVRDYVGMLLLFAVFVLIFILAYRWFADYAAVTQHQLMTWFDNKPLADVLSASLRLAVGLLVAFLAAHLVYRSPLVNRVMAKETYVSPVSNLIQTYRGDAWLLLGIIVLYRVADIVLGVSANLFYQDIGFDLEEIAAVSKTFGLIMTLSGGLLGGLIAKRYGVLPTMIVGAVASAATNLLFMIMAGLGDNLYYLIFLITADNLAQGLSLTAFVGFLSLLVNKEFTASQYAIFSSIMTLFPKILGGYSGTMIDAMGYSGFFLTTAIMGLPAVALLLIAYKKGKFTGK